MAKMYQEGDRPIPGYQLLTFLGEGGFGEVWKATNESRIEVALKIVNLQGKQSVREVFAIRKLRNVRHPNLIPILGFWLKDEAGNIIQNAAAESMSGFMLDGTFQFFVSMGLAEKTLMDRLKECQADGHAGIPLDELLEYMDESARALDFLNTPRHDMGGEEKVSIEHCDIKPQNILLVGGSVQICDFGLARIQQQGTKQNQTTSFSHNYVAPEMLNRDMGPCRTTDQYSLAVSYVQLRTGRLPFGDVSFAPAVLAAHLEGKLDYSMLLPAEQKIVKRATALNPTDRYPTARAFVDALKEMATTQSRPMKPSVGIKGPLRSGTEIVPGYKLEELIGRGSFGEVWRATAPGRLKKAIKIIRNLELASSRQELRSLDLITEVRHPYLIQIEACFLLDKQGDMIADESRDDKDAPKAETLVIVSELADSHLGKRLQDCLAETGQGLPPKELLSYMRHVAVALDRLNEDHDIIHRDVKPENILLVGGIAKLADFGLAKALEGSSTMVHTKSIGMTPAYAAPELCSGRIEKATDQYSLALTYYHLRSGRLATGDVGDLSELIRAHLNNKLDFSAALPVEAQVLRKATALKSQDRFPNCASFIKALMASFSQSELPRDVKTSSFSSVESMEEMPALSSMGWDQGTLNRPAHLAVEVQPALKATDTVNKLTDTEREAVAKAQKSTKKGTSSGTVTTLRSPARRRRSRVAQVVVSLMLLTLVGGIVGGFFYLSKQGPKPTELTQTDPIREKDPGKEKNQEKEQEKPKNADNNTPPKAQPTGTAKNTTPPKKTPSVEPERVSAAALLGQANKALQEKLPVQAAEALLELSKRYQTGETPFDPTALSYAVECYALLDESQPKRNELRAAFTTYASKQFESQSTLFKADSSEISWTGTSKLVELVPETNLWVQVFHIEKLLHLSTLSPADDAMLQKRLSMLSSTQLTDLGVYGQYLQGAIAWQLKDAAKAVKVFSSIDKAAPGITWSAARQSRVVDALKTSLAEHKQKAFQLNRWRNPIVSAEDAIQFASINRKLATWTDKPPSAEDLPLNLLAESEGTLSEVDARALLARWKVSDLAPPLQQALLYRQFQVQQVAKVAPEEMLPVALQLYNTVQQQPTLQLKAEEAVEMLDTMLASLGSLGQKEDLPLNTKSQVAQLFAARGRLIVENSLANWVKKDNRLKTALSDFDIAVNCSKQKLDSERNGFLVYQAWVKRELKQRDWAPAIRTVNLSNTPGHAQPMLLLLQGWSHLQQGTQARSQADRLKSVKNAQTSFRKLVDDYVSRPEIRYWVNQGRLGASQAYLENANYLEISDREDVRKDCRTQLELAEKYARDVTTDEQAGLLKPEANMALGNALEDFGLLLGEGRHAEAVACFDVAVEAWKNDKQYPRALMNRARAMIRSENTAYDKQIESDLSRAQQAMPEGDIASEIHFLEARVQRKKNNNDEARRQLGLAISTAVSPSFRDEARCSLLELVLYTPVNKSSLTEVKERIQEISRMQPKVTELDPQIQTRARFLQMESMNAIANYCYELMKTKEELNNYRTPFLEQLNKLENLSDPIARWHAAKHRGKWLLLQGKYQDAWQAFEINGDFEKLVGSLERMSRNQRQLQLPAFLAMVSARYEALLRLAPILSTQLENNFALVERISRLLPENHPQRVPLTGLAGLLRWKSWNLLKVEKVTLDRYRTDAVRILQKLLKDQGQHAEAWQWAAALGDLEDDAELSKSLYRKSIELIKSIPETEMGSNDKKNLVTIVEKAMEKR